MTLIKFKVDTEDTVLSIQRVLVLYAESKEQLEELVRVKYPNSKINSIKEYEDYE